MNTRILIKCALLLAISPFAGCGGRCGGGAGSVAQLFPVAQLAVAELDKNMVQIPGSNYAICKYEVTQEEWQVQGTDSPMA